MTCHLTILPLKSHGAVYRSVSSQLHFSLQLTKTKSSVVKTSYHYASLPPECSEIMFLCTHVYSMSLYDIINLCFIGTKQQYNYTSAYALNA